MDTLDELKNDVKNSAHCYYLSDIHLSSTNRKKAVAQLTPVNKSFAHTSAPNGWLVFDEGLVDEIARNFHAGVVGKRLPVGVTDETGHHKPHSAASPAWITGLKRVKDGIDVELELANPTIAEQVKNGEIQLLSAEIDLNFTDKSTGKRCRVLRGACFTPTPYIPNLRPAECINLSEIRSRHMPDYDLSEEVVTLSEQLKDANEKITQLSESDATRSRENAILTALVQRQEDERVLDTFTSSVPPAALAKLSALMDLGRGTTVHLSEVVPENGTSLVDCSDTARNVSVRDMAILLAEEFASIVNLSSNRNVAKEDAKSPYSTETSNLINKIDEMTSKGVDLATATKLAVKGQK